MLSFSKGEGALHKAQRLLQQHTYVLSHTVVKVQRLLLVYKSSSEVIIPYYIIIRSGSLKDAVHVHWSHHPSETTLSFLFYFNETSKVLLQDSLPQPFHLHLT